MGISVGFIEEGSRTHLGPVAAKDWRSNREHRKTPRLTGRGDVVDAHLAIPRGDG